MSYCLYHVISSHLISSHSSIPCMLVHIIWICWIVKLRGININHYIIWMDIQPIMNVDFFMSMYGTSHTNMHTPPSIIHTHIYHERSCWYDTCVPAYTHSSMCTQSNRALALAYQGWGMVSMTLHMCVTQHLVVLLPSSLPLISMPMILMAN